jgi:hypothetical protein
MLMSACLVLHPLNFSAGKARKRWSLFNFFIKHIEAAMANGRTSAEAIADLEALRTSGGMTMSRLHTSLQTKKQKLAPVAVATTPSLPSFQLGLNT